MNGWDIIKADRKRFFLIPILICLLIASLACILTNNLLSQDDPSYTVEEFLTDDSLGVDDDYEFDDEPFEDEDDDQGSISDAPGSGAGDTVGIDPSATGTPGKLKPVGFINFGMFNAVVRAWTFVPLGSTSQRTPSNASTVSSSRDSGGTWPNTSRFLSLPIGTYTWCIDWEEGDKDDDGYFDYYHYFDTNAVLLDETDSDDLEFAESVDIAAPPSSAQVFKGKCGQPVVEGAACTGGGIETQAHVIYMNDTSNPPDVVFWAGTPGPGDVNITFGGETTVWGSGRILWVAGDWVEATTLSPYKAMGVQVQGDRTIGWARVLFDGVEVWEGNTATTWNDGTNNGVYVEVRCFSPGQHTIRIEALGMDGGGGGVTVPVSYFGFRQ